MKDSYRRPINIECINTAYFPDIALYIKRDGNYVLYKPHDREFTEDDRIRLQRNNVDFLYVRAGDMEVISDYLESSLSEMLGREDLSGRAKGRILYQTSVNYVVDIFETPEKGEGDP